VVDHVCEYCGYEDAYGESCDDHGEVPDIVCGSGGEGGCGVLEVG